jgi:hypothetical protein
MKLKLPCHKSSDINLNPAELLLQAGNGTLHIFWIQQLLEKKWEYNESVHQTFKDYFKNIRDSVMREVEFRILKKIVKII